MMNGFSWRGLCYSGMPFMPWWEMEVWESNMNLHWLMKFLHIVSTYLSQRDSKILMVGSGYLHLEQEPQGIFMREYYRITNLVQPIGKGRQMQLHCHLSCSMGACDAYWWHLHEIIPGRSSTTDPYVAPFHMAVQKLFTAGQQNG